MDEQESNFERREYDEEIRQQIDNTDAMTARILLEMRSANRAGDGEARAGEASGLPDEEWADHLALQTVEGC